MAVLGEALINGVTYSGGWWRMPDGAIQFTGYEKRAEPTSIPYLGARKTELIDAYDKEGKQLTSLEWAELSKDLDYKRIGHDEINGYRISTIWLGLNHEYFGGAPLIFETMVFASGNYEDLACERYATEAEAKAGHAEMLRKITAGEPFGYEAE